MRQNGAREYPESMQGPAIGRPLCKVVDGRLGHTAEMLAEERRTGRRRLLLPVR